jgi:hypothetical protein
MQLEMFDNCESLIKALEKNFEQKQDEVMWNPAALKITLTGPMAIQGMP